MKRLFLSSARLLSTACELLKKSAIPSVSEKSRQFPLKKILAISAAHEFDLPKLARDYPFQPLCSSVLSCRLGERQVFIFKSGTIVGWDVSLADCEAFRQSLLQYCTNPVASQAESEEFFYYDAQDSWYLGLC